MLILNGRMEGDMRGRFTYNDTKGSSVIDSGIISKDLVKQVAYFHVKKKKVWSKYSDTNFVFTIALKHNYSYQNPTSNATNRVQ